MFKIVSAKGNWQKLWSFSLLQIFLDRNCEGVISHFSPTTTHVTHVVQLRGRHFVQALAQIGNKGKAEVLHLMVMTSDGQADGQEAMPNGHPFCQILVTCGEYPKILGIMEGCSTLLFYFILFHYLSRSQPDSHEKPSVDRLLSISSCMAVIQPAFLRYHTGSHGWSERSPTSFGLPRAIFFQKTNATSHQPVVTPRLIKPNLPIIYDW